MQESFTRSFNQLEDWEQQLILASLRRVSEMMNATDLETSSLVNDDGLSGKY